MILIGLGANLKSNHGRPIEACQEAIKIIGYQNIKVQNVSSFYETEPVPKSDQPWYVNAVIAVETDLPPHELLETLHTIESQFGRVRHARNEARVLDLDLLAYRTEIIEKDIIIPHPRMQERLFVMAPLAEIAPDWIHPVLQKPASALLNEINADFAIKKLDEAA